jgi:SAM-dependent methyltransferase
MATEDPFAKFDEEAYLAANPDVADAVTAGTVSSGLEHYRRWGLQENRRGATRDPVSRPPEIAPGHGRPGYRVPDVIPPGPLLMRVSGGVASVDNYIQIGYAVCRDLLAIMDGFRIRPTAKARVLDFGCGCGRVARYFAALCPAQLDASDIDAEAIAWNRAHLSAAATFHCNSEMPPLPFEDQCFDLVYATSVFTHFPEDMQFAWLHEMRRVVRPGGWLLLSVHAPRLLPPGYPEMEQQIADTGGFCFLRSVPTFGLPDFYRAAFHSDAYIRREWGKVLQIEAVLSAAINGHQDLVVARVPV